MPRRLVNWEKTIAFRPSSTTSRSWTRSASSFELGEVRRAGDGRVVPYQALLYDEEGGTFVYVVHGPLTYLRRAVDVRSIDGDRVLIAAGPRAGTQVVTVGAAEVYGTELEVGH